MKFLKETRLILARVSGAAVLKYLYRPWQRVSFAVRTRETEPSTPSSLNYEFGSIQYSDRGTICVLHVNSVEIAWPEWELC